MGPTRIPVDVSFEHYMGMRSILQHALQDFELTIGYEPKWLTCRLNQSGTKDTDDAFFLGWVENQSLRENRIGLGKPDPGLFRFMDPVHGDTYKNALASPNQIFRQWWEKGPDGKGKPSLKELKLYRDGGFYNLQSGCETCRQSIAIRVENRYVGTLNTGLSKDPGKTLDEKLLEWSQSPTSELVQYLKNEFNLGGPDGNAAIKKPKGAPLSKKH
jgi:hypothetical protein